MQSYEDDGQPRPHRVTLKQAIHAPRQQFVLCGKKLKYQNRCDQRFPAPPSREIRQLKPLVLPPEDFCVDSPDAALDFPHIEAPGERFPGEVGRGEGCRRSLKNRGLPRCEPPDRGGSAATLEDWWSILPSFERKGAFRRR